MSLAADHLYRSGCGCPHCKLIEARERPPHCYSFTVKERYGAPFEELTPPEGYEFTGEFRPAIGTEVWLARNPGACYGQGRTDPPVLILRPRAKRKRIIFEELPGGLPDVGCHHLYGEGLDGQTMFRIEPFHRIPSKQFTRREEEF